MKSFPAKIPTLIPRMIPGMLWRLPAKTGEKTAYLTFDDGPCPDSLPFILEQLDLYQAKATFFCIGNNIQLHPELFRSVLEQGHQVGNHTFQHAKAFSTPTEIYLEEVDQTQQLMQSMALDTGNTIKKLFRPPHGQLGWKTYKSLKRKGYDIVMWDVLGKDTLPGVRPEEVTGNVVLNTTAGSIIVLHDSLKAWPNIKESLPVILEELKKKGFKCLALP